jgi:tRNA pseudouridine32 synthase/23S rRNA pseudouridine746 synthase
MQLNPVTGRSHQLRVHMAHHLGLNTPIKGDTLYGTKSTRLHLHADFIEFTHPITQQKKRISCLPEF